MRRGPSRRRGAGGKPLRLSVWSRRLRPFTDPTEIGGRTGRIKSGSATRSNASAWDVAGRIPVSGLWRADEECRLFLGDVRARRPQEVLGSENAGPGRPHFLFWLDWFAGRVPRGSNGRR